jgi:hypothetical protein
MPQVIPRNLTRAVSSNDDSAIALYKPRVTLTADMLRSGERQALFEGLYLGKHVKVSPLFSPQGTHLIGYQIEEGAEPGKIILPEDLSPLPKANAAKA